MRIHNDIYLGTRKQINMHVKGKHNESYGACTRDYMMQILGSREYTETYLSYITTDMGAQDNTY
jgi:hypothetical protein